MPGNLENSAVATRLEKVSFHSIPKRRQCQKCSNYCTITLMSHASKITLKIFQARLQQYVSQELPDVPAGFRKGRGTRDQIANICSVQLSSFQLFSHVQFLVTPWTVACQASLSFTISWSLLKLLSIELVMPSSHLILVIPFSSCLQSFPASGSFPMSQLFSSGGQSIGISASASVLPMTIQD